MFLYFATVNWVKINSKPSETALQKRKSHHLPEVQGETPRSKQLGSSINYSFLSNSLSQGQQRLTWMRYDNCNVFVRSA